jgi:group II intron reverse transcriptase/maturase
MSLRSARRQKSGQPELPLDRRGEASDGERSGEAQTAATGTERSGTGGLLEQIVGRMNCIQALRRVQRNKGSPGVDGMTVEALPAYLAKNWLEIREELLAGTYQPKPVLRCQIPKSSGGTRDLGIPCALDRFIQQAILQVLQPLIDPTFSKHSYGFRPGRSAHQALLAAQRYVEEGRTWVVDVDLEKFFDRVNHDVMMSRLARRIEDRRLLRLIRRFLEAGVMADGVVIDRVEGTPQGGPLSPLLANVLLDEVDKELEARGLAFARYADDCNVYVRSKRAGEDAMRLLRRLFARLKLRVNEGKSAVARPEERKFLGYTFGIAKDGRRLLAISREAVAQFKARVRAATRRVIGRSIEQVVEGLATFIPGWRNYFKLGHHWMLRGLDKWIRRRLRALLLKHWKNQSATAREMRARGVLDHHARVVTGNVGRWWRTSKLGAMNTAVPNRFFDELGLPRLKA